MLRKITSAPARKAPPVKKGAPVTKSPRYDFSPLIIRIESRSKRRIRARLFDLSAISGLIRIETRHPQIPYPTLCSMLQIVQLSVNRTFLEVIKGDREQITEELYIRSKVSEKLNTIGFADGIKRQAEGVIAANTLFYKIGGVQNFLPEITLAPGAIIELKFFVPEGSFVTTKTTKATA